MKNLLELAQDAANEVLTTTSTRKESVNDSIVELLKNQGKKLSRIDLVLNIAARRMEIKYGDTLKDQKTEDLQKEMKKTVVTVKNGVDQSFANGQNNASFQFNPKYKNLDLVETKPNSGIYTIVEKKEKK